MAATRFPTAVIDACRRRGRGGSPTAVLDDGPFTDDERRRIPGESGTSHAVFVRSAGTGHALRFFTARGELPACGHGTVAALALLAERAGGDEFRTVLHTASRTFEGRATRRGATLTASFDPGPVSLRPARAAELRTIAEALGLNDAPRAAVVASNGRPRLLLPVPTRTELAAITPDFLRLRAACDRHALLGCYAYAVPDGHGWTAARMFAPSIGVPEDIANANSTACLAAHAARTAHDGTAHLSVDMGDHLASPSTITATVDRTGRIHLGGEATTTRTVRR
ncbi:PhzF family phenazine biosynthesis protein [Kitasatospora sp. NPDC001660]